MDTAANLLQIYGADVRGALIALVVAIAWSLVRECLPDQFFVQHQAAYWWGRVILGVLLVGVFGLLWWRGDNLVLNGSFVEAKKHWGTGYYEDLLRNGNFDTPATNEDFRRAMQHFPYVLHMPRPKRDAELGPVPDSGADLDYVPNRWIGGRHAYRIEFNADEGHNRFGTLSQRVANLKPHSNYRAKYLVRAERFTAGALILTTELNWKECDNIQSLPSLNEWVSRECRFSTGDTDQVDFRFVVRSKTKIWITGIEVRED